MYALDRVHFGDACAATQLEVAKNMVADKGLNIDKQAAQRIKYDMYVDDGLREVLQNRLGVSLVRRMQIGVI